LNGNDPISIKTNYSSKAVDDDMWVEIRNSDGIIIGQYFFSRTRDKDNFIEVIISSFDKGGYYRITLYKYNNGVAELVNYGSFEISKIDDKTSGLSFGYIFWLIISILIILLILFFLFFIILPKIIRRFHKEEEPTVLTEERVEEEVNLN